MFNLFNKTPKPVTYSKLISTQETYQAISDTASTIGATVTGVGVAAGARLVTNNTIAAGAGFLTGMATYFSTKSGSYKVEIDRLKKEQEFTNKYDLHFGTSDIEDGDDVYTNIFVAEEKFDGVFVDTSTGHFPDGAAGTHNLISNSFHTEALVVPAGKDGKYRKVGDQVHQSYEEVMYKQEEGIVLNETVEDRPIEAFSVAELANAVSKKHNLEKLANLDSTVSEIGYEAALQFYITEHDKGMFKFARTTSQQEAVEKKLTEEFNNSLAIYAEFKKLEDSITTTDASIHQDLLVSSIEDDLFASCYDGDMPEATILGDDFSLDVSQ